LGIGVHKAETGGLRRLLRTFPADLGKTSIHKLGCISPTIIHFSLAREALGRWGWLFPDYQTTEGNEDTGCHTLIEFNPAFSLNCLAVNQFFVVVNHNYWMKYLKLLMAS
jgi:hypothetical protein